MARACSPQQSAVSIVHSPEPDRSGDFAEAELTPAPSRRRSWREASPARPYLVVEV
jgi:hypothetical protein